jgi:hypothetical protein
VWATVKVCDACLDNNALSCEEDVEDRNDRLQPSLVLVYHTSRSSSDPVAKKLERIIKGNCNPTLTIQWR